MLCDWCLGWDQAFPPAFLTESQRVAICPANSGSKPFLTASVPAPGVSRGRDGGAGSPAATNAQVQGLLLPNGDWI